MEKKYTHSGVVLSLTGKLRVKLRETRTMWITPSGQRFRKGHGFIVGATYPHDQLDMNSIEELVGGVK
ncbi:hypothetical protein [Edwardsiella piscicida]|uniref:hypothetical protein n=1 Tax=Edwardsiella piscicida TaxID=1263550 RepID=UPI00247AFF5A|nr:hypothetical protein [Edwardsiella piscicida]WGS75577.1 hypothetical protein PED68_09375 [Edwardsiella piscicida]WGS78966.1 hypothetical protein PED70_09380 [Edwardsiella piscicida]